MFIDELILQEKKGHGPVSGFIKDIPEFSLSEG